MAANRSGGIPASGLGTIGAPPVLIRGHDKSQISSPLTAEIWSGGIPASGLGTIGAPPALIRGHDKSQISGIATSRSDVPTVFDDIITDKELNINNVGTSLCDVAVLSRLQTGAEASLPPTGTNSIPLRLKASAP